MRGQPAFFDVDQRLKDLSAKGDALERLSRIVDFELFRDDLARPSEARHGTARHGTARHGTARHGTARHGRVSASLN